MEHNKKYFLYFIGMTLFVFYVTTTANAKSPQQIAKKALASTMLLVMEDVNGQPLSFGSRFLSAVVKLPQTYTSLKVLRGVTQN